MGKKKIEIVVSAVDKATRNVRKINDSLGRLRAPIAKLRLSFRSLARAANFGKIGDRFRRLGRTMRRVGIAATGAAVALGIAIKRFAARGDLLAKTARKLGLGVETLQELRFAADRSGVGIEKFDKALAGMSKRIGEAKAGTGQLITFLKKGNPVLLKQLKAVTSNEEAFNLMVDAITSLEDPTAKAALASAAFGRTGVDLINVLALGRDGVQELRQEFRELGGSITQEGAESSEEFTDAMTNLKAVVSGIGATFTTQLLPRLTDLADRTTTWLKANRELVDKGLRGVGNVILSMIEFIPKFIGTVKSIVSAFGGLRTIAIVLAGVIAFQLASAIAAAIPVILAFGAALFANPIGLVILAVTALAGIVSLVIAKWKPISGFFKKLWSGILSAFEPVAIFFENLWSGILSGFESIRSVIPDFLAGSLGLGPIGVQLAGATAGGGSLPAPPPVQAEVNGKVAAVIKIESEVPVRVTQLSAEGDAEIAVDSGPVMSGI